MKLQPFNSPLRCLFIALALIASPTFAAGSETFGLADDRQAQPVNSFGMGQSFGWQVVDQSSCANGLCGLPQAFISRQTYTTAPVSQPVDFGLVYYSAPQQATVSYDQVVTTSIRLTDRLPFIRRTAARARNVASRLRVFRRARCN